MMNALRRIGFRHSKKQRPQVLARSRTLSHEFLEQREMLTVYFIDATDGNDSYNGLAGEYSGGTTGPWQTIEKVNSTAFQPGDSILFQRGETWHETLTIRSSGSAVASITYGAYGSGDDPVINGADVIDAWTLYDAGNNVWVSTLDAGITSVTQVLVDGERQTLARWPNTGWSTIDATSSNGKYLYDTSLSQADDYWIGGTLVIRSCMWAIDTKTITDSSSNAHTISWDSDLLYGVYATNNWGYYIEDVFEELDASGEWYFDAGSHLLYLALPSGETPANHTVEASVREYNVYASSKSYVTLTDLDLVNAATYGIYYRYARYMTIENCDISHGLRGGIFVYSTTSSYYSNLTIRNNTISHVDIDHGITIRNSAYAVIENNVISNIASDTTSPNYGWGIKLLWTPNSIITGNTITEVAGHGLYSNGGPLTVTHNTFTRCVTMVQDNGAIYFNGNHTGTVIAYNRIDDMPGSYSGTSTPVGSGTGTAVGIYFDEGANGGAIHNNIVSNCAYGTLHHRVWNVDILNNTFYNNRIAGISFQEAVVNEMYGFTVMNNICYGNAYAQSVLTIWRRNASTNPIGTFDNNVYYNPYRSNSIRYGSSDTWNSTYYTLAGWKAITGRDSGNDANSLSLNPQLVNAAGYNFHLTPSSPCVNAGVNVDIAEDFDGVSVPQDNAPDIGAYEYFLRLGDANYDGYVNEADSAILAQNWLYGYGMASPDATWSMGDYNGDGMVDAVDATIMAANWSNTAVMSTVAATSITSSAPISMKLEEEEAEAAVEESSAGMLPGDANGDGVVDEIDAAVLAANWRKSSGAVWADGDFDGDGRVDDADAKLLAVNWRQSWATSITSSAPISMRLEEEEAEAAVEESSAGMLPGDANGDGVVDEIDAAVLAANWRKSSGAVWADGDFDGDSRVDDADVMILARHWLMAIDDMEDEAETLDKYFAAVLATR